jgi:hypothetical protein
MPAVPPKGKQSRCGGCSIGSRARLLESVRCRNTRCSPPNVQAQREQESSASLARGVYPSSLARPAVSAPPAQVCSGPSTSPRSAATVRSRCSAMVSTCFCHFHQRADRPPFVKSSPCAHGTRGCSHDYGSHEGIAIFAAQVSAYPRVGNADAVADSQLRSD